MAIDTEQLTPPATDAPLVIEGAGGLLIALTETDVFADVFARWQFAVIFCARTGLGTSNHTLLSLEALRHRAIRIFGIAFIGNDQAETIIMAGNPFLMAQSGNLRFSIGCNYFERNPAEGSTA